MGGGRVTSHWSRITDDADTLAPYEVFARSAKFSVYTVAASHDPVAMNGGLPVLPTYDFADGPITTSAAVSSGIPASLHVMQKLAGTAEAAKVSRQVR